MAPRTGYLTIFSADGEKVYGEFADAQWITENTGGGSNHVMSGVAGEGAAETFRRVNEEGTSNVSYTFESGGVRYRGQAQLLAPEQSLIRIETGESPASA
jgi:hypothetical protein